MVITILIITSLLGGVRLGYFRAVAAMEVDKLAEKVADMFKTKYIKHEMF